MLPSSEPKHPSSVFLKHWRLKFHESPCTSSLHQPRESLNLALTSFKPHLIMKFNYSQTAVSLHMQLPLYFDVGRQEEKLFFFFKHSSIYTGLEWCVKYWVLSNIFKLEKLFLACLGCIYIYLNWKVYILVGFVLIFLQDCRLQTTRTAVSLACINQWLAYYRCCLQSRNHLWKTRAQGTRCFGSFKIIRPKLYTPLSYIFTLKYHEILPYFSLLFVALNTAARSARWLIFRIKIMQGQS